MNPHDTQRGSRAYYLAHVIVTQRSGIIGSEPKLDTETTLVALEIMILRNDRPKFYNVTVTLTLTLTT